MNSLGLIFSILLVVGMFILLRRIERWLHQHIFKVGWLLTKNFQTTTILYYTFFLPGVFLHELTYWLTAGILNVRATVSIPFFKKEAPPSKDEKQAKATVAETPKPPPTNTIDISKLKPNFVTLDFGSRGRGRQAQKGVYRKAIISTVPLLVALVCIWLVADNIFNIMGVVATMASGELPDIVEAFNMLTGTPNFWLWVYIVFTIANTMFPFVPEELRGWRTVLITTVAVTLALTLIGVGGEIFRAMQSPLNNLIAVMEVTLILVIIVDVLMVLVLGTIEYVIEHVTGNTATFRGSTMEVMTREEAASFHERELQRQRRREERFERQRNKAADSGLSSVYMLMLPIPGAPGEEPITQVIEDKPIKPVPVVKEQPVPTQPPEIPAASTPIREKPEDLAARIHIPERQPLIAHQPEPDTDEAEDTEARPAATLADRSATATTDKSVDIDVGEKQPVERDGVSPFAHQLVSPISESDDEAAPVRTPISQTPTTPDKVSESDRTEENNADDEPAKPIGAFRSTALRSSPIPKSDETDDESDAKPAKPVTSRFGVSPIRSPMPSASDDTGDIDDDKVDSEVEAKPAATFNSRFSVKPFTETIEDEVDELEDEDSSDEVVGTKPIEPLGSRFSPVPFQDTPALERDTQDVDEDDTAEDEKSPVAKSTPDKPIGQLSESRDKIEVKSDDDEAEPAAPIKSRFGVTPFKGASPIEKQDDEEQAEDANQPDEDMTPAQPKGLLFTSDKDNKPPLRPSTSRFGTTPLGRRVEAEDDENEEDEDESYLRRGRGDDAVSSLFSGLNTSDKTENTDEDDDDEEEDTQSRFSRFSSRPSAIGRRVTDDDDVEYADDEEYYEYHDADDYSDYDDDADYGDDDD